MSAGAAAERRERGAPGFDAIARRLAAISGWGSLGVAALAGALSVAAMPPIGLWPVLFLTFPALLFLLDGARLGAATTGRAAARAAAIGFAFGLGYFIPGLYWMAEAFLIEPERHAWLIPFAVIGSSAYLALFPAAGSGLAMLLWRPGPARLFALAIGLGLAEMARGVVLTGFPWNALGYALTLEPGLMQTGSLVGVYGLSLIAVLMFASPALLFRSGYEPARRSQGIAVFAGLMLLLAGMAWWGHARLAGAIDATVENVRLRLVQAAVPQDQKWSPERAAEFFTLYLRLTLGGGDEAEPIRAAKITHVVWPETALPFRIDDSPAALAEIDALLPDSVTLLMGSVRMTPPGDDGVSRVYNSLFEIEGSGRITGVYDKIHLVPFGEFLPFQDFMERVGIMQLTGIRGGFSEGEGPRFMEINGAPPASPLVCYEAIFPHEVTDAEQRPGWLLNITNDAWFGTSAGPYQHFHQARVRSVEQGLPLVRSANTGISAVIDAFGREIAGLGLGETGVVDANLPQAIPPTLFSIYGRLTELALLLAAALLWGLFAFSARRREYV